MICIGSWLEKQTIEEANLSLKQRGLRNGLPLTEQTKCGHGMSKTPTEIINTSCHVITDVVRGKRHVGFLKPFRPESRPCRVRLEPL